VFERVTCVSLYKNISHRVYDCSYSLSPIKVRICGVYISLVTVIETNLNITDRRASVCFTEYKKFPLTKVFRAPARNSGFYIK